MKKTLVIYSVNGKLLEAFEYDDSCRASRSEALRIILEAQKLPDYGRYELYHGSINDNVNRLIPK